MLHAPVDVPMRRCPRCTRTRHDDAPLRTVSYPWHGCNISTRGRPRAGRLRRDAEMRGSAHCKRLSLGSVSRTLISPFSTRSLLPNSRCRFVSDCAFFHTTPALYPSWRRCLVLLTVEAMFTSVHLIACDCNDSPRCLRHLWIRTRMNALSDEENISHG